MEKLDQAGDVGLNLGAVIKTIAKAGVASVALGLVASVGVGAYRANTKVVSDVASASASADESVVSFIESDTDFCPGRMTAAGSGTAEIGYNKSSNIPILNDILKATTSGSVKVTYNKNLVSKTTVLACMKSVMLEMTTHENVRDSTKPTVAVKVPVDVLYAYAVEPNTINPLKYTTETSGWGTVEATKTGLSNGLNTSIDVLKSLKEDGSKFYTSLSNVTAIMSSTVSVEAIKTKCVKAAMNQESSAIASSSTTSSTENNGPLAQAIRDGIKKDIVQKFNSLNPTSVKRFGKISIDNVSVEFTGDKLTTIDMQSSADLAKSAADINKALTDLGLEPNVKYSAPTDDLSAPCVIQPGAYSAKSEQDRVNQEEKQ